MKTRNQLQILIDVVLLTASLLGPVAVFSQIKHASGSDLLLAKVQAAPGTVPGDVKLPACPPAGLVPMQSSSQTLQRHQVFLTWNASAVSDDPERAAVGYCLYRSKKKGATLRDARCADCEQISSTAIAGTNCVDTLVEDNVPYYYVATAINYKGKLSASSNEVPAQIAAGQQNANPAAASPPPLCRTP